MKLQSELLQINFLTVTPKFQALQQLGHDILRCDIPFVPLQYTVWAEMWPFKTQLHCSNYKWQLHVSATQQPSSGCLCEKYKRKFYTYIQLKMICGWKKMSHLTYSGIRLLHDKCVHNIKVMYKFQQINLMFMGPCIIFIVD